jgi:hypothetical protein
VLNSSAAALNEISAPQRAREASRMQRIMSTSSRRLAGDRQSNDCLPPFEQSLCQTGLKSR